MADFVNTTGQPMFDGTLKQALAVQLEQSPVLNLLSPRQVMNGEPNIVTVAGGTPRRVHSRPNAAIARGAARKNAGSFHTFVISSSMSSGVGAPLRVLMRCSGVAWVSRP